ncbi:MAG: LamG domain-containing protein [Solirubrobacteraceae bacterium]|nr:LamG domain-containing protein [Solirubrobacteraceae bacterium]
MPESGFSPRSFLAPVALALLVGLYAASPAVALDPGIAGQWHFDAISGSGASTTTADSSGADQAGKFAATPTLVAGRFGSGLGSGWMNVTRPPGGGAWLLESPRISFTVWIKQNGFPGTLRYIAGKGAIGAFPTCGGSSWAMYTGYPGRAGLAFYVKSSVGSGPLSPQLDASSSVWDGRWHAVTGTYDGTAVRLYLDGVQVGNGTPFTEPIQYTGADQAHDNFTIGTYPDKVAGSPCGVSDWPGGLDEVRVHDRALTQAEITKLHDPNATTPPDLAVPGTDPPPVTTPRPPFDIVTIVPRNIVPPELTRTSQPNNKALYKCSDGVWEGIADNPKFVRQIWSRETGVSGGKPIADKLVTGSSGYILSAISAKRQLYCVVKAKTPSGATITASGPTRLVPDFRIGFPVLTRPKIVGDLRIRGIDVFQVVQPLSGSTQYSFNGFPQKALGFPTTCGGGTPTALVLPGCTPNGAATQQAKYNGVLIDADKPTTAVVYLDRAPDTLASHENAQIQVKLRMTAGARVNASRTQTLKAIELFSAATPEITARERGDETMGVEFELPQSWVQAAANGTFDLTAKVSIVDASDLKQCSQTIIPILNPDAACTANDTFTLTEVFSRYLTFSGIIRTIGLTTPGQALSSLKSPQSALKSAVDLLPAGEFLQISNYVAQVPIDPATAANATNCPVKPTDNADAVRRDCASATVKNAVRAWVASGPARTVEASPTDGFHVLAAFHNYMYAPGSTEPGSSFNGGGVGKWGRSNNQPYLQINDGTISRPMTAAAHELVHAMGAPHAGVKLQGIGGDPSCGGDNNGQVGEPWPNDQAGRLQGVKFDPSNQERTVDLDFTERFVSQPLWDFMSYCTGDPTAWLSARNWNRAFAFMVEAESVVPTTFQVPIKVRAKAAQSGPLSIVPGAGFAVGVVIGDQARITGLEPADPDHVVPTPDPGSTLRVRGLRADGSTIAEVGARVSTDTETGGATFIAPVPKGSAAVELVSNGTVVDRRAKGPAPKVTLTAPRKAGARISTSLKVRYRASNAQTATIQFSPDGRTKWRTVYRGPATGKATLPMQLLRAGTAAKVRVKVSSGFATAQATSPALKVDGRPPTAKILLPAQGDRGTAAAKVVLFGQGADENGKRLRKSSLTWYAGKKRLGTGERLRVSLPAGRTSVRLVAKDKTGRTTTAKRTVRVDPVALELQTLKASQVKAGAKRVTVTVKTNVAATLRSGGTKVRVGPKARKVRLALPAKPAVGFLRLSLRLTPVGGGETLRPTLEVLRG